MSRSPQVAPRRVLARLAVVAALSTTAVIVPVTAAHATPTGCTAQVTPRNTGVASCTGGTGLVRVIIECVTVNGTSDIEFGPFVAVGQVSEARCLSQRWSLQPEPWYELIG
jgi:hypothetical protein